VSQPNVRSSTGSSRQRVLPLSSTTDQIQPTSGQRIAIDPIIASAYAALMMIPGR
jgi:hypothetical protein